MIEWLSDTACGILEGGDVAFGEGKLITSHSQLTGVILCISAAGLSGCVSIFVSGMKGKHCIFKINHTFHPMRVSTILERVYGLSETKWAKPVQLGSFECILHIKYISPLLFYESVHQVLQTRSPGSSKEHKRL